MQQCSVGGRHFIVIYQEAHTAVVHELNSQVTCRTTVCHNEPARQVNDLYDWGRLVHAFLLMSILYLVVNYTDGPVTSQSLKKRPVFYRV